MARRSDHTRGELKQEILNASWKIVRKEGFEALTARRIATEIGYAPGTIYNIFKDMHALTLALNAITLDKLHKTLSSKECNNPRKKPLQNMKSMATLYRDFAKKNRQHWLMLFTYILPENKTPPAEYQEKIARVFEPLEELLIPYFTPNQSRKRKMAARVLWASVHGLYFLEETGKIPLITNQKPSPDMSGYLIETFIKGLQK
ncbi:TetR/AcrR family transcriptional regulator [Alphaproteobacteria bacterium]|nr:TetR/AcrR family transcriptional regulator [Alphaproteobacteria bacterium]